MCVLLRYVVATACSTSSLAARRAGITVDRRMLADLAVNDAGAFKAIVAAAKAALPADVNAPKAA